MIFRWLKNYRKAVFAEVEERMKYFGNQAYSATRAEAREARKRGDSKRERFLGRVAVEIAKYTDHEIGFDTATRMIEAQEPYEPSPIVRPKGSTLH